MFAWPLVILFAESESSSRSHLVLGRCFGQPLSFCSQALFLFVNALSRNVYLLYKLSNFQVIEAQAERDSPSFKGMPDDSKLR